MPAWTAGIPFATQPPPTYGGSADMRACSKVPAPERRRGAGRGACAAPPRRARRGASGPGHGPARLPAGRPGGLEIVAPRDAVDVEHLAGEVEPGADPALHGRHVDLAEANPAARHELLLVH